MIFFFKPKPLHIDCLTNQQYVYEYAPIEPSRNFIPDWWKQLPKKDINDPSVNMRYCSGFNDLYKHGLVLPLWSDINVTVGPLGTEDGFYQYSDKTSEAVFHPKDQRGTFADDSMHLKLRSPWLFKCNEDINWLSTGTPYNQTSLNDYTALTGISNFKNQYSSNANLMFGRQSHEKTIYIKHGTPLLQFIPLDKRKTVIHNHVIDDSEYQRLRHKHANITFQAKYYKILQSTSKKEKKCPFH